MNNKYKVAIIGCGKRGAANARTIKDVEALEMVALVDVSMDAAAALKEDGNYDKANVYNDYQEMLQKESPDICIICLWTVLHLDTFRKCAEAGVKAVLMEKPMASTWGECKEIARIAEKTGCHLFFSHQRRFHKGNQHFRKYIKEGVFGEIIRMDLFSPLGLLDCGTHTLDQASSFIGDDIGVKWVHGAIDLSDTINAYGVSDGAMFTGTIVYENGILANIFCNSPDVGLYTGVRLFGTKGFAEVDWGGKIGRYALYDNPHWKPLEIVEDKGDVMKNIYAHIIDCIELKSESEVHYKKALRTSEIIFALYESVRRRKRIELPLERVDDNPISAMLLNGDSMLRMNASFIASVSSHK